MFSYANPLSDTYFQWGSLDFKKLQKGILTVTLQFPENEKYNYTIDYIIRKNAEIKNIRECLFIFSYERLPHNFAALYLKLFLPIQSEFSEKVEASM